MFLTILKWLLIVLVVAGAVVGLVLFLRRRAKRKAEEDPEKVAERKAREARLAASRSSRSAVFAANMKRLDGTGTGGDQRYKVPWCLLVGEESAGRTSLLRSIELHRPFGAPESENTPQGQCDFWFFDRGLVIDAPIDVTGNDERWVGVLQSIRRARKQRPIDSLVLAIPATDLAGPSKLDTNALKEKAEGLYRGVRRIQEELGVLMPIYVVVTKTDVVPGFAESCRALPVSAWEEMFGWSSPHTFETSYSPEWVTEAFKNVNATIAQTQMDLLAASPAELKDPDAVYTLPYEFSQLEAPLHVLLDQIFKPTSYHEAFALRGIYFAGDPNIEPTDAEGAVIPVDLGPAGSRPIFTTQLFESKVFTERGLSRPATRSKTGNRQAIMALQYALIAVGILSPIALWTAASSLGRKVPPIADSANVIQSNLDDVNHDRLAAPATPINQDVLRREASDTLQAVSRVRVEHLWQIQLPTSWFSDIDVQLRKALKATFEGVVLFGYQQALQDKHTALLGQSELAGAAKQPRIIAPENMAEFQALHTIDQELHTFSEYADRYNGLAKASPSEKLETVNRLANYLLALNLGPSFVENGPLYMDALTDVSYQTFDASSGPSVDASAEALSRALMRHAFENNPVEEDLKEIVADVTNIESSNSDADTTLSNIKKLSADIARAKGDIAAPEMAWLGPEDLGKPFTTLLESMKKSPALPAALSQSFDDRWHDAYKQMRRRMLGYATSATGPLLTVVESDAKLGLPEGTPGAAVLAAAAPALGKVTEAIDKAAPKEAVQALLGKDLNFQLSSCEDIMKKRGEKIDPKDCPPNVAQLADALTTFLDQEFVKVDRSEALAAATAPPDSRILWSGDSLDKGLKLGEPYDKYLREKVETAPEHVRSLLEDLAKEELELDVKYLTLKGERPLVSEAENQGTDAAKSEMSTELASLKRVITQLRGLLDLEDRFELTGAGADLRRTLAQQGQSLLRRIDALLEQGELYTPDAKLLQWQGVHPPALEAFDLAGADALGAYLRTQKTRIADLSRDYAQIPVQILEAVTTGSNAPALLTKWQRIASELAARDAMQPGNSVQALEQFIQSDMLDLTGDNCVGRLPKRTSEAGDFFLGKLAALRNIMRQRCEDLNGKKLLRRYDFMAAVFNETLANHFPFSADESETQDGDASPSDITKFLREYDSYMPEFEKFRAQSDTVASNGAWGPFSHEMLTFLSQMKDVRTFFAPLLSQDGQDVNPRYGFRLTPRVNKNREVKANEIIQWDLLLSGQHADVKSAMWTLGDPVRVAFRFAKDSPDMPSREGQPRHAGVNVTVSDDDTVNFDFGGSWSLLRLIRACQAPSADLDGGLDSRPHTLEFEMRVEERPTTDEAFGAEAAKAKARAFVRVSLTAPDGVTRIVAPKIWPTHAPQVVGLPSGPGQNPEGPGQNNEAEESDGESKG